MGMDKPRIRFKGYTNAWEQRKLGDVLQTLPFKPFLKEPEQDGKFEIIQQGNDPVIGFANGKPCEDYADTVIFGDHTLSLYKPECPFFVATDGVRIVKGKQKTDGFYLLSLLEKYKPQSEGYKRYYAILADSGCFITTNDNEQERIGAFFRHLDRLITLHQRKCDETKKLKKFILQKMFPKNGMNVPEIRFNGFTDAWEQRKAVDIAEYSKGNGYSKSDLVESGTPIILYGRLYTNYQFVINEVDTFAVPKEGAVYSQGNEVIIFQAANNKRNWQKGRKVSRWYISIIQIYKRYPFHIRQEPSKTK